MLSAFATWVANPAIAASARSDARGRLVIGNTKRGCEPAAVHRCRCAHHEQPRLDGLQRGRPPPPCPVLRRSRHQPAARTEVSCQSVVASRPCLCETPTPLVVVPHWRRSSCVSRHTVLPICRRALI